MRPPFYLRQLRRDLDTWIAKGLVDADNKEAILASVGAGSQVRTLDVILAIFGVSDVLRRRKLGGHGQA
jgi:hypothetical protein